MSYENFPRFRNVDVWDNGRRIMNIAFRVINDNAILDNEPTIPGHTFPRSYTLEVIIRGNNGQHVFADQICDCVLKPVWDWGWEWTDRCKVGRYVYDTENGDDLEISNQFCQITIRVNRDATGEMVADVVDERVFVKKPQWGRMWRRPKQQLAA